MDREIAEKEQLQSLLYSKLGLVNQPVNIKPSDMKPIPTFVPWRVRQAQLSKATRVAKKSEKTAEEIAFEATIKEMEDQGELDFLQQVND